MTDFQKDVHVGSIRLSWNSPASPCSLFTKWFKPAIVLWQQPITGLNGEAAAISWYICIAINPLLQTRALTGLQSSCSSASARVLDSTEVLAAEVLCCSFPVADINLNSEDYRPERKTYKRLKEGLETRVPMCRDFIITWVPDGMAAVTFNTVVPLLVATLNKGHPL